jgi:large subunit ribosomal protein L2
MSTIKVYKPTTAARRKTSVIDYSKILTGDKPYKNLIVRKARSGGRNDRGVITTRHIGGGAKKMVRLVNFKNNFSKGFKVNTIEYCPGRTAFICLVTDLHDGKKHYILHTKGMTAGRTYGTTEDIEPGAQKKLGDLPPATQVCQVEINPGQGSKMIKSAGNYGTIIGKDGDYVSIKLPSGEIRRFQAKCLCVVGQMGNDAHGLVRLGLAGRNRHLGVRPTVRGKVMNPVDHPHGGGEARNSIGMKYPKTPWGKHANGVKTRDKKKPSGKFIISRRPPGKHGNKK